MTNAKTNSQRFPRPFRQNGITLVFALIALIAMALAGVALVRAVQTTNQIAGNFSFRNAALHAADVGVEKAFAKLQVITSGTLDAKQPSGCTTGCYYYPTMFTAAQLDAQGIPTNINWSNVTGDTATVNGSYTTRYVIERLCSGALPITNLTRDCYSGATVGGGTKKAGGVVFSSTAELYFRVTVRVEGPRNTVTYVQSILAH
jgi:Tfp pilus assembly protein PilX